MAMAASSRERERERERGSTVGTCVCVKRIRSEPALSHCERARQDQEIT